MGCAISVSDSSPASTSGALQKPLRRVMKPHEAPGFHPAASRTVMDQEEFGWTCGVKVDHKTQLAAFWGAAYVS